MDGPGAVTLVSKMAVGLVAVKDGILAVGKVATMASLQADPMGPSWESSKAVAMELEMVVRWAVLLADLKAEALEIVQAGVTAAQMVHVKAVQKEPPAAVYLAAWWGHDSAARWEPNAVVVKVDPRVNETASLWGKPSADRWAEY